ncbi:hypothetical protein [Demequina litorisediminis]|uniref:hypothetical protein n=1 Tax=Demequina litorisediminis TaxID=1849022 RepID=UPI0024E08DA4|nr:hypothetical protein [Demequina litorisediminis]
MSLRHLGGIHQAPETHDLEVDAGAGERLDERAELHAPSAQDRRRGDVSAPSEPRCGERR